MIARRHSFKVCPMCLQSRHGRNFRNKQVVCWMCFVKPEYASWASNYRANTSEDFLYKMSTMSDVDYSPNGFNLDGVNKNLVRRRRNVNNFSLDLGKPLTIPPLSTGPFEQEILFEGARPLVEDDVPDEAESFLAGVTFDVGHFGDGDDLHTDGSEDLP